MILFYFIFFWGSGGEAPGYEFSVVSDMPPSVFGKKLQNWYTSSTEFNFRYICTDDDYGKLYLLPKMGH